MTFKDLKLKLAKIQGYNSNTTTRINHELDIFKGKQFYCCDTSKLGNDKCCFQHIVGLLTKNDKQYPIFDYEKIIFNTIENNQNIWIKKARGLGVTTFLIRYLAWKILSTDELDGKSIFIASGTREEFANYVKNRLEQIFEKSFP